MRLLFVADGRSPIAINWISYFSGTSHEVHLVSTYPCEAQVGLASVRVLPIALNEMVGGHPGKRGLFLRKTMPVGLRTRIKQWLGPLALRDAARQLSDMIGKIQPELVHAMRIPFEGMLTVLASPEVPVLVSVWGNDFTLHAGSTPLMRRFTRHTLKYTSALHADCQRDLRLARKWGFPGDRPTIVLPSGGGIQMETFYPPTPVDSPDKPGVRGRGDRGEEKIFTVINPRGFRAYVRNDTFFKAIPLVLEVQPATHFICPAMAGEVQAQRWVSELGINSSVELLPKVPRVEMADLFRRAQVVVSPTIHDGTPNTLLEAMACGCFPIAGDIEALREWITPGVNGLLIDPDNPRALAEAILAAMEQAELREQAALHNIHLIAKRAEYGHVMGEAERFYRKLAGKDSIL